MAAPKSSEIRFRVDPGDVPPEKAARRLHLTLARFNELLPNLLKRGFPPADPDTGMFDLDRIDEWRAARHGRPEHEPLSSPAEPRLSSGERMSQRIRERYQDDGRSMGERFAAARKAKAVGSEIESPKPGDMVERMIAVLQRERSGRKPKLTPP